MKFLTLAKLSPEGRTPPMKFLTLEDGEAQLIVDALHLIANHYEDQVELNDLTDEERTNLVSDISRANDLAVGLL